MKRGGGSESREATADGTGSVVLGSNREHKGARAAQAWLHVPAATLGMNPHQLTNLSRKGRRKGLKQWLAGLCVALAFACVTGFIASIFRTDEASDNSELHTRHHSVRGLQTGSTRRKGYGKAQRPQTLVLYSFSHTDFAYHDNLRYYVRHGIAEDDGCRHLIIVNNSLKSPVRISHTEISTIGGVGREIVWTR